MFVEWRTVNTRNGDFTPVLFNLDHVVSITPAEEYCHVRDRFMTYLVAKKFDEIALQLAALRDDAENKQDNQSDT